MPAIFDAADIFTFLVFLEKKYVGLTGLAVIKEKRALEIKIYAAVQRDEFQLAAASKERGTETIVSANFIGIAVTAIYLFGISGRERVGQIVKRFEDSDICVSPLAGEI